MKWFLAFLASGFVMTMLERSRAEMFWVLVPLMALTLWCEVREQRSGKKEGATLAGSPKSHTE